MATSFDELVRELKAFDRRRDITRAMSKGIRKAAPPVRKKIRAAAVELLPRAGGLGTWVSKVRVNLRIKTSGRRAAITMVGGLNADGGRADMKRIDAGRVRAPSWGHKTKAAWHNETVPAGFFTDTAADATEWKAAVDDEVDAALETLRRG